MSFIVDDIEKTAAYNCKAISCHSDNSYQISLQNCNLTNFGYLCVKGEINVCIQNVCLYCISSNKLMFR